MHNFRFVRYSVADEVEGRRLRCRGHVPRFRGGSVSLLYSNLSMGEFSRTNGPGKTFAFAIEDIFTGINLAIAFISGLIGYVVVEYLRKKI
jgi:hypothetical protein